MKMKIDAIDEKSILVELSKEDLSKSEITYEELDYANERTRKLVQRILETIRLETGKTVYKVFTGTGRNWNNSYGPITIGPNGTAYVGVFNGLISISDQVK